MPEKQTGHCEVIRVGITYSCYHELYLLLNALEFNTTGSNTWYRDIISQLSSRRLLLLQAAEGQLHVPHTALDEVIKAPWHTPAGSVEVKSRKQPRRLPSFQHAAKCWNQKHHESWCFLVHIIHKSKYLAMPWSFCLTSPRSSNRMRFTKAAIAAVEFNAWITSKPSCCDGAVGAANNKNSQTQNRC